METGACMGGGKCRRLRIHRWVLAVLGWGRKGIEEEESVASW